jgi:hypothetical protein
MIKLMRQSLEQLRRTEHVTNPFHFHLTKGKTCS